MSLSTRTPIKPAALVALMVAASAASAVVAPSQLHAQSNCAGLSIEEAASCRAQQPAAKRAVTPAPPSVPSPAPNGVQQPSSNTPNDTTTPGIRKIMPIQPRVGPAKQ
jgi:hypothetical protein